MADSETPLLDDLEEGPWPSFVTEMKRAAAKKAAAKDLLRQLERSYRDRVGHWKHGGIVGVKGYGGGVIGRYTDLPEEFPAVAEFHTMRVNMPSGWFYTTKKLRELCDVWDKHGSGLTNMHGATGDIILLGTQTAHLQPCFDDLAEIGYDLGGSGSDMRTPSCCVGPGRCEYACIDTLELLYDLTMTYQDQLHRPMFPYKSKMKISGCPNDCVAAVPRSDIAIVGTWRDKIRVDPVEVAAYADGGMDIARGSGDALPHPLHDVGRQGQDARHRGRRVQSLYALHQHHAEGAAAWPREGRDDPGRRQGAHRPRRAALLGDRPVHQVGAALHRAEGAARKRSGNGGMRTARCANAWAS